MIYVTKIKHWKSPQCFCLALLGKFPRCMGLKLGLILKYSQNLETNENISFSESLTNLLILLLTLLNVGVMVPRKYFINPDVSKKNMYMIYVT